MQPLYGLIPEHIIVIIYPHTPFQEMLPVAHFNNEEHRVTYQRSHRTSVAEEETESEIQINIP